MDTIHGRLREAEADVGYLRQRIAELESELSVVHNALQDAIETIEWMHGCTEPAEDEIDRAISRLKQAL